jgi:hypothetical protein
MPESGRRTLTSGANTHERESEECRDVRGGLQEIVCGACLALQENLQGVETGKDRARE